MGKIYSNKDNTRIVVKFGADEILSETMAVPPNTRFFVGQVIRMLAEKALKENHISIPKAFGAKIEFDRKSYEYIVTFGSTEWTVRD